MKITKGFTYSGRVVRVALQVFASVARVSVIFGSIAIVAPLVLIAAQRERVLASA